LFTVRLGKHNIIWRELTRREYRHINQTAKDEFELEELLCATAVLHPPLDYKRGLAGIPGVLAPLIAETSGFMDERQLLDSLEFHRGSMSQFENQAETYIKVAFPQYTFEEMADWTVDKLTNILARAEWALTNVARAGNGSPAPVFEAQQSQQANTQRPSTTSSKEQFKKAVANIREQGMDPMIVLSPQIISKPAYIIPPLIGGTSQWRNEVILDAIRKQIPGVSE